MKSTFTLILCFALLCFSCSPEEDEQLPTLDLSTQKTTYTVIVDMVYLLPSEFSFDESLPTTVDGEAYIQFLNEQYFHAHDIGFVLGTTSNMKNDELFNLKDNRGEEAETFLKETEGIFNKKHLTIYIISRSNIIAIAGIGKEQRALLTDENLFTTTSPHEIGHALGLYHTHEHGNIMHDVKSSSRHAFNEDQVDLMKETINQFNKVQ